ncbi:gamma-glutamyltransferase [Reyranella sp.]|uniref:gamma-glutamyltransferase n=1 Tax=Reyranella sp. TaxID=1929291 RepID=UPI003BAD0586
MRSLALAGLFLLAACGRSETDRESDRTANAANPAGRAPNRAGLSNLIRTQAGFAAVSAGESRAAEVGRDILQAGGNATDAAVAMYFATAVTLPSAAGLGASGACIVHDEKSKTAEAFVFPPIAAPGSVHGQPFAVPSGVRAITLMHVRHGQLRWEQTVAPAERLARFGVPVSHALGRDLLAGASFLSADREAQRLFGSLREGSTLVQPELAGTLGSIRQRGGGEFFQGRLARTLSEQISAIGGSLPVEALRNAVPQASAPTTETYGRRRVYVAPPPAAGALAVAGWKGQQPAGPTPTSSNGFSGFVAVDAKAGATACALSMGQLFGARAVVPGLGVMLGAPTPEAGSVSPLIVANPHNGEFTFAGAGGGAPTAAQATGSVARATVEDDQPLANVLSARGGRGGWVNALVCPNGLRSDSAACRAAIDPTGAGLALIASDR